MNPVIVPRAEHNVSRKDIAEEALKVLYRLRNSGFKGYLVGGGVRDLLLGRKPKDFDLATDAHPGRMKALFRNSRVIGRRFRIVHVFFRTGRTVEVSTFRRRSEFVEGEEPARAGAPAEGEGEGEREAEERGEGAGEAEEAEERDLLVRRDNTFGTPEEDALRRDLTINGLFYDISTFSIIDYVGGLADLRAGLIRTIGDPDVRFREDPVRMIRAVRHAARTGFRIEPATHDAILRHAGQITRCSSSRLLEELYRDMRAGSAAAAFRLFLETGLLGALAPGLAAYLAEGSAGEGSAATWRLLEGLDGLTRSGAEPPNALLLAVVAGSYLLDLAEGRFAGPVEPEPDESEGNAEPEPDADSAEVPESESDTSPADPAWDPAWALQKAWRPMARRLGIAKRDSEQMIQILLMQPRLRQALARGVLPGRLRRRMHIADAMSFFRLAVVSKGGDVPQWLFELKERAPDRPPSEPGEKRRSRRKRGGRRRGRGRGSRPAGGPAPSNETAPE